MKKKIIFATEALWIGGIETALVNLLNRLDYEKYDVTCLILRDCQDMAPRITPKCRLIVADREHPVSFSERYRHARLYHLTEHSDNPSRLHRALMWLTPAAKWAENRLYIRYICRQMRSEFFDTAIIYSDRVAETTVRGIRAKKYLMFYHHGAMRKVYHDEIGYRRSEKIIAVSQSQEAQLRRFRSKYAEKMMTIHNLSDIEGIRQKGAEPIEEVFPTEWFHIVSCGRVSHEKGMDLAVEACAELIKAGHENVHWWIVGGGPAEEEVKEAIARLHMENHMTMLGMKRNPYPYIKMADLYVQPSRFEGYPMTILEALILGHPVISTNSDGAREILRPGETGLLCDISGKAVAETILPLLEDPEKLTSLQISTGKSDMDAANLKMLHKLYSVI